jgi:glycosyltransferase involved in cell wall biosynthesis
VSIVPRRILFVQHAGSPGGSVMSLRYLVEGLVARNVAVSVAMVEPNPDVRSIYEAGGAAVYDTPGIPLFRHTTAGWARAADPRACLYQARAIARATSGGRTLLDLISRVKPDVVHLNSVTLALMARHLRRAGVPVVWHVRESPVSGYLGLRRRFLRRSLLTCADEVIFLSESDRRAWVHDERGVVVPNVVPMPAPPDDAAVAAVRRTFGAAAGDRLIAYVGGCQEIKGVFPLIEAVRRLRTEYPGLRILAPGMTVRTPTSWRGRLARRVLPAVGLSRDYERASAIVESGELRDVFLRQPFVHDILPVLAAAEFLVFPSTRPHFARPVVEAAAVGRPAIGSRLGGVSDLIEDGQTGVLVPAGDESALADAIRSLLADPDRTGRMGEAARQLARERFDADAQVERIVGIYRRVLGGRLDDAGEPE